jgi:transcriptional antiterminator RfaH
LNAPDHWYVIQCKTREERRALENLERQDFHCYLPLRTVEKIRSASKRDICEPLFPTYLFIRLNEVADNWHPISSTRGVVKLVRFQEYPVPVADELIDMIRERLASTKSRTPYLQPGERVRITEGAFANLEAIFVSNDGLERAMLLMNILHHEQVLSFPVTSLRKIA